MKKFLVAALSLCVIAPLAYGEVTPKGTGYDKRIKNIAYNPDNVTRINVATGITTLIQFSPSEFVSAEEGGVAIGDPEAWDANLKANNLWIRPIAIEPDTNMVVVTNKRTYQFNLVFVRNKNAADWSVRFNYPENKNKNSVYQARPCSGTVQNYRYFAQGDKDLFPVEVWDNGLFTCMRIRPGSDMPAVFKKLPDGKEGLVNSHVENDYIVIHEINPEFRLRLGDLVAGVKTDRLKPQSANITGTTNGKVREVINE